MDPVPGFAGFPQTQHPYVYCLNNSVNLVDPSGKLPPVIAQVLTLVGLEALNPLPLEVIIWPLAIYMIGQSIITGIEAAPDVTRALERVLPPPVKERTERETDWEKLLETETRWEDLFPDPPPGPDPWYWVPRPKTKPQPQPKPTHEWRPTPCPPATKTPQPGEHRVLIVGDGDFGYSRSLSGMPKARSWEIVGTAYGDGSNSQTPVGVYGNLALYTNVDAKRLESGTVTGMNQYDAIVFNNPHDGDRTASLINGFRQSARRVLAPGGKIHINVTQKPLLEHEDVAIALGLPNNNASTIKNLPSFGQTRYYAPFTPHYSTGGAMEFYRYNQDNAQYLKNFQYR